MKNTNDVKQEMQMPDILVNLGAFLFWAEEDGAIYGAVDAQDAVKALQNLMGWDDQRMEKFRNIFIDDQ